jgi:hypothetical protein
MPLNLNALNPQQQIMLAMLLRQGPQAFIGGGMQQPTMAQMLQQQSPGISPQQARMQQILNPPPSPLQQVIQQLAQVQQGQQQTLQAVNQPNPLLQQLNPQLQALVQGLGRLFSSGQQAIGLPQSSGVTST